MPNIPIVLEMERIGVILPRSQPPAGKRRAFKFLIFGDSQAPVGGDNPYGLWRKTCTTPISANPDAKFMVNVGDLVDYGQMGAHWNAWFAAAKGVIDRIPEMAVSGNHEYFGSRDMTRPQYWAAQWVVAAKWTGGLKRPGLFLSTMARFISSCWTARRTSRSRTGIS